MRRRKEGGLALLLALLLLLPLGLAIGARAEDREVTVLFLTGEGAFADGENRRDLSLKVEEGNITLVMPEAPQRTYYVFTGWRVEDLLLSPGEELLLTAPEGDRLTIRAEWRIDPATAHRLTLDPQEGTLAETSLLVPPDGAAMLPAPVRTGCNFLGWCRDPQGEGELLLAGTSLTLAEDVSLYAQWEASSCKVTISVRHLGRSVTELSYALLQSREGLIIPGESNGTGVFAFSEVPDGVYTLVLSDRSCQGRCGEILVEYGRVLGAEMELEMWP